MFHVKVYSMEWLSNLGPEISLANLLTFRLIAIPVAFDTPKFYRRIKGIFWNCKSACIKNYIRDEKPGLFEIYCKYIYIFEIRKYSFSRCLYVGICPYVQVYVNCLNNKIIKDCLLMDTLKRVYIYMKPHMWRIFFTYIIRTMSARVVFACGDAFLWLG